jgi:CBS domain-containing protein
VARLRRGGTGVAEERSARQWRPPAIDRDEEVAMSASASLSSDQLTVGQFMRSPTTTVEPDSHVASAAYLMKRSQNSALVVTADDHGRTPLAIVTDADISQAVADGKDLNDTRLNQLHLPRPAAVEPTTPVATAAAQMLDGALMHLPVVEDGKLVGLVDISDMCRALLEERTPA